MATRADPFRLSSPRIFLVRMAVFLILAGFVALILEEQIARAFMANPPLNGLILGVLLVLATGATALYGPQAACLVELFPSRVRYTALSLPYHVGTGWVGGFLPATAYAMASATGDSFFGLWYPVVGTAASIACALLFLPETRGRNLDA